MKLPIIYLRVAQTHASVIIKIEQCIFIENFYKNSLHYAALNEDKAMIQKLLDYDFILQQKIKTEEEKNNSMPKPKPKPKIISKMLAMEKNQKLSAMKVKVHTKYGSILGIKQEKALELNTTFEREYTNSEEFQIAKLAYINLKDYEGRTALHAAVLKGNYEIVKILVYNKASLFIRDRKEHVFLYKVKKIIEAI